jgi:MaoC like domain
VRRASSISQSRKATSAGLDSEEIVGGRPCSIAGIIMHGMNNFGLITRMLTDWAQPAGAIHRRLEARWLKPVKPGVTIRPTGVVKAKQVTSKSRWVSIDVMVSNQRGEKVAAGEAMITPEGLRINQCPRARGDNNRLGAISMGGAIDSDPYRKIA